MLTENREMQSEIIMSTLEEIVPEDSLYRKVERYIDFTFIYDEVRELYCENNGRPSIDPVVLFKLVFIQALSGIKSMRETCRQIKVNSEYRWFLGIPYSKTTPHFSTFGKNYERRFKGTKIFQTIFENIVMQAVDAGLVSGETLFTDSTHKKANANKHRFRSEVVEVVKKRQLDLEEEINEERRNTGRKEFEFCDETTKKEIKVSTTDEESGYYHRSEKEKGFMYLDHRTTDDVANIIVDCYITKGNVHDSVPYIDRLEHIKETYGFDVKKVALDAGYGSLEIKKYLIDNQIFGVIGYKRVQNGKSKIRKYLFQYDKNNDTYICPETGVILENAKLIDKNGYKSYRSPEGCKGCEHLNICSPGKKYRTIRRHIWEEVNEQMRENRISPQGKELYSRRKETVERSFADSKQNHGYRYAMYRGLEKNQDYTWLICSAQNMKTIARRLDHISTPTHFIQ